MKYITYILLALFALPVLAQGSGRIDGTVKDTLGQFTELSAATVLAIALPEGSPPFNELIEGEWQSAANELYKGVESVRFGGISGEVDARSAGSIQVDRDGSFALKDLPLKQRLGLAVLVQGLWWPLRTEVWLTSEAAQTSVELLFSTTTNDATEVRIVKHSLIALSSLSKNLKYASIRLMESIVFENSNPLAAYYAGQDSDLMRIQVAVPPGITSDMLVGFYGSQLQFAQGLPLDSPILITDPKSGSWMFGRPDAMGGASATWSQGPQFTPDSWHQLNSTGGLSFTTVGETIYEKDSKNGPRLAYLRFCRVIPAASNGQPGRLEIRILHSSGINYNALDSQFKLKRQFGFNVKSMQANLDPNISLKGLVTGAGRKIYQPDQPPGHGFISKESDPAIDALKAGEIAELSFGLSKQGQIIAQEQEAPVPASQAVQPPEEKAGGQFQMKVLFILMASIFGLAFLIVLVHGISKADGRTSQQEKQLAPRATKIQLKQALGDLKSEYDAGKIPASEYKEHRRRLMNCLISAHIPKPEPEKSDQS